MHILFRRLRGIVGAGLAWGAVWATLGALLGVIIGAVSPEQVDSGETPARFAMVLGTAAFVVSLPFTITSHSTDEAAKTLVRAPTAYTFKRPLGRFISCTEQPDFCK